MANGDKESSVAHIRHKDKTIQWKTCHDDVKEDNLQKFFYNNIILLFKFKLLHFRDQESNTFCQEKEDKFEGIVQL